MLFDGSVLPTLTHRREGGTDMPLLVWRLSPPRIGISSSPLGGGIGTRHWVINATVPMSYHRDDPDNHLSEMAGQLGLDGPGVGLLTGVDVADLVTVTDDGVTLWATIGLGAPIWAATPAPTPAAPASTPAAPASTPTAPSPTLAAPASTPTAPASTSNAAASSSVAPASTPAVPVSLLAAPASIPVEAVRPTPPGTVNLVVDVPVRLSDAALVNAVATVAEAKAQALWDLGIPATGTATDATCVLCPADGPVAVAYGGPRSIWGARIARAVHRAISYGAGPGGKGGRPWSDKTGHTT